MAKLTWDETSKRLYETGVRQGVLYPQDNSGAYPKGVAWNGLTAITESPSGAEETALWADDIKYLSLRSAEEFGATIEAYTYPDEFAICDGSAELATGVIVGQQPRKPFGLCYRTVLGNDTQLDNHGYKLHLIYGATASPSERAYQTVNDSPEAITFSWEMTTVPVAVKGARPTACVTIDSTKVDSTKLAALEAILYGYDSYIEFTGDTFESGVDYYTRSGEAGSYIYTKTTDVTPQSGTTYYTKDSGTEARLPLPDEIKTLLA